MKKPDTNFLSVEAWKEKAQKGENLEGVGLVKTFIPEELKVEDGEDGLPRVKFVISTEARDRHADSISVKGWELDNYRKNPVVLYGHFSSGLPIGQAIEIGTKGKKLEAVARFDTDVAEFPLPRTVVALLRRGTLRAASVGFIPWEWEESSLEDVPEHQKFRFPLDYKRQELVEFSVVPIPSNPEALSQARSAGIDISPVVNWAGEVLEMYGGAAKQGLWVPRSLLEKVATCGSPTIVCSPEGGWSLESKSEEKPEDEKNEDEEHRETSEDDETETEEERSSEEEILPDPSDILSAYESSKSIARFRAGLSFCLIDGSVETLLNEDRSARTIERTIESGEFLLLVRTFASSSPSSIVRHLPKSCTRSAAENFAIRLVEQKKDSEMLVVLAQRVGDEGEYPVYSEQAGFRWKQEEVKDEENEKQPPAVVAGGVNALDVIEAVNKALGPALRKALSEMTGRVDD